MNVRTLPTLAAVAFLCTACSTPQYVISTKEGHMVTAYGKPRLDDKSGLYTYEDSDGKKRSIKKDDVAEVMEK